MKVYGSLEDANLEVIAGDPANLPLGRIWFNSATSVFKVFDGTVSSVFITDTALAAAIAIVDHGAVLGLSDDDHTIYVLLVGRAGGQSITGGTAASESLTLQSTSDATKGSILLGGSSAFNEVNNSLGLGTAAPTSTIDALGGSALLPAPATAAADGDLDANQWTLFLDETLNQFKFKAKKADTSVISATIGVSSGTRAAQQALASGVSQVVVTFSSALASTSYSIAPAMSNIVDADPLFFSFRVVAKATTGFTIDLNDSTDSVNYVFEYTATESV